MRHVALAWLVCQALACSSDLTHVNELPAPCVRGVVTVEMAQCPDDADVLVCEDGYEPVGYFPAEEYKGDSSVWCSAVFCESNNPCVLSVYYGPFGAACVDTPIPEMNGKPCTVSSKDGVCNDSGECVAKAKPVECAPTECIDAVLGSPTVCIKTPKPDGTSCGESLACVGGACKQVCKTSADPICSDANSCTSDLCDILSPAPYTCYHVGLVDGAQCALADGVGHCSSGVCLED